MDCLVWMRDLVKVNVVSLLSLPLVKCQLGGRTEIDGWLSPCPHLLSGKGHDFCIGAEHLHLKGALDLIHK